MHKNQPQIAGLFLLATLLLSACASRGIQLPESQFLRALESKSGRIAYLGSDGNLYTIDQAGSEQVQITGDPESPPIQAAMALGLFAWSPDGSKLAYVAFDESEWSIRVTSMDGGEGTRVFGSDSASPIYIAWSPDGDDISFLTLSDPAAGAASLILQTVPAAGGQPAVVLAEGFPVYFAFEPEGSRVLAHIGGTEDDNPDARISLVDRAGGFERDLELPPASFQAPSWSPDGVQLLMAIRDVQGHNGLVLTNLQGRTQQTLTTFEGSTAFTWSPRGDRIAYITSERTRQGVVGRLTVVDPDEPEDAFTTEENLVHAFFWSPDGKEIVFFTQELVSDEGQDNLLYGLGIHFLNLKDREVRHIRIGENPFVFQPTPQFRRFLLGFDQFQQGATIWSPDSEYVVISALTGNQGVILVLPVSGTLEPRHIVDGMMALWSGE